MSNLKVFFEYFTAVIVFDYSLIENIYNNINIGIKPYGKTKNIILSSDFIVLKRWVTSD